MTKLLLSVALIATSLLQLENFASANLDDSLQDDASLDYEYNDLCSKLRSERDTQLTPIDTLNKLKKFAAVYTMREDEDSANKAREINKLIELSHISDKKCTNYDLISMNEFIEAQAYRSKNILPYMLNCRMRQFEVCKTKIEKEIKDTLDEIDSKSKSQVQGLVDAISKVNEKDQTDELYKSVPHGSLVDGVLSFIRTKSDLSEATEDKVEFRQKFKRLVNDPCVSVLRQLAPLTDYYVPVIGSKEFSCQIEKNTLSLMGMSNVCREIFKLNNDLIDLAFQEMKAGPQKSLTQMLGLKKVKEHTE